MESAYKQKVNDIATNANGDALRVSEIDTTTTFLSELADPEGAVVIRVFFKKSLKP